MKHDCDIVRDLMPMCIDGTASEKARKMVDEHVAECPPCDKVYAEMKGETKIELPVQPAAPEFVTTVKKMKNRRKRRTWLTLLLGVLIAAVVALAGFLGYFWYFVDVVPLDTANLSLVTSNDGIALIRTTNVPRSASMQLRLSEMVYPESAKGQYEVRVIIYCTRFEARHKGGAEIYFVVGNVEGNTICIEDERWANDVQVYRMLYGHTDGTGKVFYLAGEDELKAVSLKGMSLKSPEAVSRVGGSGRQLIQSDTITPTPTIGPAYDSTTDITDSGNVVIRRVNPMPTMTPSATPTPTAKIEYLNDEPAVSVPAGNNPVP